MEKLKIRIGGVPEHFNLPWHVWMDSDGPDSLGIQPTWTDFPGGSGAMIQALESAEIDLALVLTEAVFHALDRGSSIQPLAVYVESPLIWGIFSGAQNQISSVESKSSPVYAISRMGSGSHLMARVDAHIRALQITDNQWKVIQNLEGAKTALTNLEADLFFWEKWMTKPLVDSGFFKMIDERPTPWACFLLVSRKDFWSAEGVPKPVIQMTEQVLKTAESLKINPTTPFQISSRYGLMEFDAKTWLNQVKWASAWRDPHDELTKAEAILREI